MMVSLKRTQNMTLKATHKKTASDVGRGAFRAVGGAPGRGGAKTALLALIEYRYKMTILASPRPMWAP